jgi:hypothetical protein
MRPLICTLCSRDLLPWFERVQKFQQQHWVPDCDRLLATDSDGVYGFITLPEPGLARPETSNWPSIKNRMLDYACAHNYDCAVLIDADIVILEPITLPAGPYGFARAFFSIVYELTIRRFNFQDNSRWLNSYWPILGREAMKCRFDEQYHRYGLDDVDFAENVLMRKFGKPHKPCLKIMHVFHMPRFQIPGDRASENHKLFNSKKSSV